MTKAKNNVKYITNFIAYLSSTIPGGFMLDLDSCLEKLLLAYSHNYNIYRDIPLPEYCCALGEYHDRVENYVLSKRAVVYAMESNDYVYFALCSHLNKAEAWKLINDVLEDGRKRIDLKKDHMCSIITAVILCEQIDDEAKKLLKRFRYHHNFKFGFKGWSEMRIAAMSVQDEKIIANNAGKLAKETLKNNFRF